MECYILDSEFLGALEDSDSPAYKKILEKLSSLPDEDEVYVSIISLAKNRIILRATGEVIR